MAGVTTTYVILLEYGVIERAKSLVVRLTPESDRVKKTRWEEDALLVVGEETVWGVGVARGR